MRIVPSWSANAQRVYRIRYNSKRSNSDIAVDDKHRQLLANNNHTDDDYDTTECAGARAHTRSQ